MKKFHPFTAVGFSLALASIALLFSGYQPVAAALALVGFVCTLTDVPRFTSIYQLILFPLQGIVLGYTLDYGHERFPFFACIVGLIALAPMFRLYFIRAMLHTKFLGVEPPLVLIAIAGYVFANIHFHEGWQSWFYPLPPLGFTVMLVTGFMREGLAIRKLQRSQKQTGVGNPAPDFSLPNQFGEMVTLSEFKGKRHVLLIFLRGDWCPACHMMMRTYETAREKLREKSVLLMAIGPDDLGTNRKMAEKIGVEYFILTDDKQSTSRAYGSHMEKDPAGRNNYKEGLPLPSTFIICDKGIIRYQSRADDVGEFLHPEKVAEVLESIR